MLRPGSLSRSRRLRRWCAGRGLEWVRRRGHTGLKQGPVQDGTKLADGLRAIDLLSVDEHGRGSFHTQRIGLANGNLYAFILLSLDAGLKFCSIQIMFLSLGRAQPIERRKLSVLA